MKTEKSKYCFDSKNHVHILDGKNLTGTSSIGNVLAKPLTWWASGLAVEQFGWRNPKKNSPQDVKIALYEGFIKIKQMCIDEYAKLLADAYKAHATTLKEKASAGTDLHEELESWVKCQMGKMPKKEYDAKIQPFIDWASKNVKKFIASEAHCYDDELWVGGITDCVAELNDGKLAVIDFKSAKDAYPVHFLQASGYAIQIEKNGLLSEDGKHRKKISKPIEALIVVPFGADVVEPKIRYDVDSYKQGFRSAVTLYRLLGLEKTN